MKISVTYESVLDSIHAHTALVWAGGRNGGAWGRVPPILHSDHDTALLRVAEDAAAVVCARLAAAGVAGLAPEFSHEGVAVECAGAVDEAQGALAARVLRQAVKYTVLHIAYRAAGLPDDYLARADEALEFFPTPRTPGTITPWP